MGDISAFFLAGVGEDLHCGGAVESYLFEEVEAGGEKVGVFYVGFCEVGEHDAEGGAVFDGLGACLALVWGGGWLGWGFGFRWKGRGGCLGVGIGMLTREHGMSGVSD